MVKHRLVLFVLALLMLAGPLWSQTVAEDVLRSQDIQGVEFKNYVGPHKVIESRLAIQGIGADLGRQMQAAGAQQADYGGKYQVLRLHDASSDRLSADLFILGPTAGVDHIRNLNWIVSAYLQQAFGYSVTDADLLASFVTRYNAFYRGRVDYVQDQYIPPVAANLTVENAGLALSWTEWAGKTRMLIPLRDSLSKGLSGSLNTEEISNSAIITQMAQEPGAGLEDRKKLADLKEGEIVQEQKAIAQAEGKTGTVPPGLGTTPASPSASPSTTATPSPAATAPTTPAAALPLEEAKKDLAARDSALQAERQDIVKQENKTPAVPQATPVVTKPASTAAFVRMTDSTKTGQVWLIDPTKNTVWKKSELNTVRQPDVQSFGPGLLVVAGDTKGANGAVRLVLLSKDDASILLTGADDVLPDTPLLVSGNQVLALTKGEKNTWVLGAFDASLKLVAKGTDALTALTSVVLTSNGILVQSSSGPVLLLDPANLKKKTNTEG